MDKEKLNQLINFSYTAQSGDLPTDVTDYEEAIENLQLDFEGVWKEAQKELLEEVRQDMKDVQMVNVDKYINMKLKELD